MIDRDKVWAGTLNATVLGAGGRDEVIGLYDTTLRDGEQTVGVVLTPQEKLEIAQLLDAFGVDRIEVLVTARSVVRWSGPAAARAIERLQRVARERLGG